jgi:hypothetical protein
MNRTGLVGGAPLLGHIMLTRVGLRREWCEFADADHLTTRRRRRVRPDDDPLFPRTPDHASPRRGTKSAASPVEPLVSPPRPDRGV